jgi:broad specificity phosphatase PhoE
VDEIKTRFNGLFKARKKDPLNVSAPGGESIGQVHARVLEAARDLCVLYPREKVVISAHGVVLAILRLTAQQLPVRRVFEFIPENAVIHQIELEEGNL